MDPIYIILIVVGALALSGVGFYLFAMMYAAHCIYIQTLSRENPDSWGRDCHWPDEEHQKMDAEGMLWQAEHGAYKKDVHIIRDGTNLYGEYYDLGHKRCVLILSGRTESLRYGYYFARPYSDSGYNVLVVDPRGHGLSDGKYNTVGFEESKDALAWARYIHDEHGAEAVIFHGICIGAAAGMLAITDDACPEYIRAIVTDGMFVNFACSMTNNLIQRKRNYPILLWCIDFWMKHYTGHSMMTGPIDVIHKLDRPLLMIQGVEDVASPAENGIKLYRKAGSTHKYFALMPKGGHSMLRYTDSRRYDTAIKDFLESLEI
jgi:alpha-beta hydrolase superfamily lysophospholipase